MSEPMETRDASPAALKAQILATEHWSLLATRSLVWTETFSRATWFLTVVSGAVVALGLVAQADDFGSTFRVFALSLLPILALVGLATFARLMDLNKEDVGLVAGMNRLRHGYLDLAPELEPYFSTSQYDDRAGILRTYSGSRTVAFAVDGNRQPIRQYLSSTPLLIGIIDAVLVGALAGVACSALDASPVTTIVVVGIATLITLIVLIMIHVQQVEHGTWPTHPRFPTPPDFDGE
jgi:hypothetical protein